MKGDMLSLTENQEMCLVSQDMKQRMDEPILDLSGPVPSPKPRSKVTAGGFKKKPTTLPNETVEYLKAWMMSPEHIAHPYPTESEKAQIMADTGLELKQLTNWFVNNRKRYWKPRVEARLGGNKDASDRSLIVSSSSTLKREVSLLSASTYEDVGTASDSATNLVLPTRSSKRRVPKEKAPMAVSPSSVVHLVSGHNSVASSDGTTSGSDSDEERCSETSSPIWSMELPSTVEETLDVHILRPSQSLSTAPDLSDVTVLSGIPPERILRTYSNCTLAYSATDGKDNTRRRDAEVVRLKRKYLSLFLKEQAAAEAIVCYLSSGPSTPPRKRPKSENVHVIPSSLNVLTRPTTTTNSNIVSPRPKYRRFSIDIWKEACQTANHVYDDQELPSLEEATRLFGYAN
jgi:Homeobox KN domain